MLMMNNIRSGQLLSPFGIGQIINFPEEISLMVCGLDLWDEKIEQKKIIDGNISIDESTLRIIEPRLQKLLEVEYFVKPFPYITSGMKNSYLKIPAVRFPKWYHCTNQSCGRMSEEELTLADEKVVCSFCGEKMIPVRFVAACTKGHIQDVPFKEWVHNGPVPNDGNDHLLSYHALPGAGDLGSIWIKCVCGANRTLAGLMNIRKNGQEIFDSALARIGLERDDKQIFSEDNKNDTNPSGEYCRGYRPWLGKEGINDAEKCNKHLQVLIRGGSNIHYANIISALYLPEFSGEANEYVVKVLERETKKRLLEAYNQDNGEYILPFILESTQEVKSGLISKQKLLEGVIVELEEKTESKENDVISEENLRIEEYNYILTGRDSENTDFKAVNKTFESYNERDLLEINFDCVVLIEKLKETRVFRGFSRVNPVNHVKKSELSKKIITWLPASEVYGEGIFLKFREDKIAKWQKENGKEFTKLIYRFHTAMSKRKSDYERRDIDASFIMLHTFAHLLIKRLCFSCGYGSSSLKERIYFSSDKGKRMNGILIYTSSGDSEGSLGGLVRQGRSKFLGKLVKEAIEDARWCSADPVCSDIGQASGQGPDNVNGSACHNCCIVPETSCEEFNMLLDRATIIGTIDENCGYFN